MPKATILLRLLGESREHLKAAQSRLRAAGLDIEWRPFDELVADPEHVEDVDEDEDTIAAAVGLGGGLLPGNSDYPDVEASAIDGTLRLYDTPETIAAKAGLARMIVRSAADALSDPAVPREFVDSNGARRVSNRWGFNSFATLEDAEKALIPSGRSRRSTWYLWRLADGTFDYTATDNPSPSLPGHPATLVKTVGSDG